MESTSSGIIHTPTSGSTGGLSIRRKLRRAFMLMIALTLAVNAITYAFQQSANTTINELVQVHGKPSRFSLEADQALRVMQSMKNQFLPQYQMIGIQRATARYLFAPRERHTK